MDRQERALVKETKALIKEVEGGETAHAAWIAIRDRVEMLYDERTQGEVGDLLGKSDRWVSGVLAWDQTPGSTPFSGATPEQKGRGSAEVKKILRDPEIRKQVIEELPAETADEIEHELANRTRPKTSAPKSPPVGKSMFEHFARGVWMIRDFAERLKDEMPEADDYEPMLKMSKTTHQILDWVEASLEAGEPEPFDWDEFERELAEMS